MFPTFALVRGGAGGLRAVGESPLFLWAGVDRSPADGQGSGMSLVDQQIRALAERVATSHGLEVVDLEFQGGGGKHRTLRVFLERNAAGRAALEQRLQSLRDEEYDREAGQAAKAESAAGPATPDGSEAIVLDMVEAGALAGLDPEDDELAYLRELPSGVPVAQLSGITHGDCERFARDFGTALDVEDLVPGAEYMLEASSPGLDRRLSKPEEFERFEGQLCKLQTFTPVAGNRHWQGYLGPVTGEALTLLPVALKTARKKAAKGAKAGTGQAAPVQIALSNIEKAQLVPEF